mmetsp:Transcript_41576/g.115684  ORF Transcript_41576/g.115684 Transcript_41576/m.115684 type:complete len:204 (+) Transcript_41576:357-968(+)
MSPTPSGVGSRHGHQWAAQGAPQETQHCCNVACRRTRRRSSFGNQSTTGICCRPVSAKWHWHWLCRWQESSGEPCETLAIQAMPHSCVAASHPGNELVCLTCRLEANTDAALLPATGTEGILLLALDALAPAVLEGIPQHHPATAQLQVHRQVQVKLSNAGAECQFPESLRPHGTDLEQPRPPPRVPSANWESPSKLGARAHA